MSSPSFNSKPPIVDAYADALSRQMVLFSRAAKGGTDGGYIIIDSKSGLPQWSSKFPSLKELDDLKQYINNKIKDPNMGAYNLMQINDYLLYVKDRIEKGSTDDSIFRFVKNKIFGKELTINEFDSLNKVDEMIELISTPLQKKRIQEENEADRINRKILEDKYYERLKKEEIEEKKRNMIDD